MKQVTIDPNSGFCGGVIHAIRSAEQYLSDHSELCALGELVHNSLEMDRLRGLGLRTVSLSDAAADNQTVLIRAHGEPPSTYKTLEGKQIIDCTCPVVLKLQKDVRTAFEAGHGIVIFGKPGHPEVIGLAGQTGDTCVIVSDPREPFSWNGVVPDPRIYHLYDCPVIEVFSQTTKDPGDYAKLCSILRFVFEDREVIIHDSICKTVSSRFSNLTSFARSNDVIVFVAGKDSSNGKVLFDHCRKANPQTFFICGPEELMADTELVNALAGAERIGICGATSTPKWLLENVAEAISATRF